MKKLFLLIFCFFAIPSPAQDSALARIMRLESDTERVNQLYKKGFAARHNNPKLAMEYAVVCEREAGQSGSPRHRAKSLNLLGILYYKKGDFSVAQKLHEKALELRINAGDLLGQAYSHTNLGNIFEQLGKYNEAEAAYLRSLKLYDTIGKKDMKANALVNLGVLKQERKEYNAANEYYQAAHKIAQECNDYEIRCICLNNLAALLFNNGEYEKAIGCNMDALKLRNLMDNQVECADSYLNLGQNYLALKEYSRALGFFNKAYKVSQDFDYFEGKIAACRHLAEYYSKREQYKDAFKWLNEYQDLYEKMNRGQVSETTEEATGSAGQDVIKKQGGIQNFWLALFLGIFVAIVPLFLFYYKR